MTDSKQPNEAPSMEVVVAILNKTRAKLAEAVFRNVELEALLDLANEQLDIINSSKKNPS
jgi:hypothetical protein